MALVEVRPLDKKKWHGKTGKDSFSRPQVIEVLYDEETGRYATGLTKEEADEYSKKLGGVDLSDTFNYNEAHPYWSTKPASFTLPNHTVLFDTSKPADFVKVKNMKASKYVANSQKEYDNGKWPFATHIIFDETEEAEIKASKIQTKFKATKMALELSSDAKIAIIQVLRNKNLKGRSNDFIDVEMDDILANEPNEFLRVMGMGREEILTRASVIELHQKGVLTKEGPSYYYLGEQLGFDFNETVKWFQDPNNQKLKIILFEKLENK